MPGKTVVWSSCLAALVLACSTAAEAPDLAGADDSYVAPAPLAGTYWRLIEVAGEDGTTAVDPELRAHIMLHEEGSRLGGSGGCNRILGNYEHTDGALAFNRTATTKMACEATVMTQEQALLDALAATTGYVIDGEALTLIGTEGDLVRFERYLE